MRPAAIALRLATPHDCREIGAMSRDHVEHGLGWRYDATRIARALRRPETSVVAACDRDTLAGFAMMDFGAERAHLVLMAVRPAHRRRGVGRRLVEWLLASARAAGIQSVHLELRASNSAARCFYAALGFSESILVPGYYGGVESALRMLRLLHQPAPEIALWRPPAHWR